MFDKRKTEWDKHKIQYIFSIFKLKFQVQTCSKLDYSKLLVLFIREVKILLTFKPYVYVIKAKIIIERLRKGI